MTTNKIDWNFLAVALNLDTSKYNTEILIKKQLSKIFFNKKKSYTICA